ncbi:MAG: chromate transporter [Peptostreptococcaceae bacterium]
MIYLTLYLEFLKVGLFTVGGGLAALPFLYDLIEKYNWFDKSLMADMIAISQSTPGPIGINMATFTGYTMGGFFGGIIATLGFVTPSVIIITIIFNFLQKFKENPIIEFIFKGVRVCVCALIFIAFLDIAEISILESNNNLVLMGLFLLFFYLIKKFDKHPVFYISLGALIGIIFKL